MGEVVLILHPLVRLLADYLSRGGQRGSEVRVPDLREEEEEEEALPDGWVTRGPHRHGESPRVTASSFGGVARNSGPPERILLWAPPSYWNFWDPLQLCAPPPKLRALRTTFHPTSNGPALLWCTGVDKAEGTRVTHNCRLCVLVH